jgi:hypothetical protein
MDAIREMIRRALSKSKDPDPKNVGRRLFMRLSPKQIRELAQWALSEIAQEEVRKHRSTTKAEGTTATKTAHKAATGRTRWNTAIRERVHVGTRFMFLEDCGVGELMTLVAQHEAIADSNNSSARRYRALAAQLERTGVSTVGQLNKRQLREAA